MGNTESQFSTPVANVVVAEDTHRNPLDENDLNHETMDMETTEADLHSIQAAIIEISKHKQHIEDLTRVADKQHRLAQDVAGEDSWHTTAGGSQMQRLMKVFGEIESGNIDESPEAVAKYEKDLAYCQQIVAHLQQAIVDYGRLRECRGGMQLIRYTYNSCRAKGGTLYLTGSDLVWLDDKKAASAITRGWRTLRGGLRWPLASMQKVIIGVASNPLRYAAATESHTRAPAATPWLCFSVVCTSRTCDFSVENEESVITWVRAITCALNQLGGQSSNVLLSEEAIKARMNSIKAATQRVGSM